MDVGVHLNKSLAKTGFSSHLSDIVEVSVGNILLAGQLSQLVQEYMEFIPNRKGQKSY